MRTLRNLQDFDRAHLWHPYTSMTDPLPVFPVVSARGVRLRLADGRELIDGMASWWAAIHGYNHPALNAAARRQIARTAHVMFGGLTHEPAVDLVRRLLRIVPAGLECAFLCDSGSVAVEVAMKMAIQYWAGTGQPGRTRFVTVRGGYHGDTLHAMSVCDPVTGMHGLFRGVVPRQWFAEAPPAGFDAPWDESCMRSLRGLLARHGRHAAALILEPIVQGAGGMRFHSPRYLARAAELAREAGVLLILDEIATGFGRTGRLFAAEHAGVSPDILCAGKALTGGYLSLGATLATRRVAEGVSAAGHPFMHGPTFMGNPLACAVASASIEALLASPWRKRVARIERELRAGLDSCRDLPGVADVRVLGAIGVVEMCRPVDVAAWQREFVKRGVWLRPFGRLVYAMPPYVMKTADVAALTGAVCEVVRRQGTGVGTGTGAPARR
jgi:adenosylmethionine-8-amino-7-oxononanoate aminotransferase